MIKDKDIVVKTYKGRSYQFKYLSPEVGLLTCTYIGYKKEIALDKFKVHIEECEYRKMLEDAKNEGTKQNKLSKDA